MQDVLMQPPIRKVSRPNRAHGPLFRCVDHEVSDEAVAAVYRTKMSNCLPEDGMANLSTGMLKEICFGQLN